MRVRIKLEREPDGGWCALTSGTRGFNVSPVLAATRAEALDGAQSATLFGLAYLIEQHRTRGQRQVIFVVSTGRARKAASPRCRPGSATGLQVFSP